jgi:hypothetical protein
MCDPKIKKSNNKEILRTYIVNFEFKLPNFDLLQILFWVVVKIIAITYLLF